VPPSEFIASVMAVSYEVVPPANSVFQKLCTWFSHDCCGVSGTVVVAIDRIGSDRS